LHTVLLSQSTRREGHLHLYSGLVIGHKEKDGVQRVMSHPFAHKLGATHSPNRQDLVFVRPPDQPASGARLSMESVWFCKVLLIFTFQSRTDSGIKEHKCAFVSVLWEYEGAERPGSNYFQLFIITFNCLYFLYFQHGSTIASLLSFMSNMLEKKSFTCCLWRICLARLPLCLWDLQAQSPSPIFHAGPCTGTGLCGCRFR
jgi:hypothetical protein